MFSKDAPALFGADEDIDNYCIRKMENEGLQPSREFDRMGDCIAANINIMSMSTARVPYNICRNLEWQVCAARGMLPGQGNTDVLFATNPSELNPRTGNRPLGQCAGWKPMKLEGGYGYGNIDIYYLELCLFAQLCTNSEAIFRDSQPFTCNFSKERFRELQRILQEPIPSTNDHKQAHRTAAHPHCSS